MAFENFFTPIELENGLVSPSKVEKLVSLLQQVSIQNGKGESLSHWSTIAKVLSVTQSSDCLRNFIRFGGLKEIDSCLQEAQVEVNDSKKPMEDLTIKVLDVLKKLPIDKEGLKGCGISNTITGFLSHKNIEIQSRAESLSTCWGNKDDAKEASQVRSLHGCDSIFVKKTSDNTLKLDCQETCMLPEQGGIPTEGSVKDIHKTLTVRDSVSNCGHGCFELDVSGKKNTNDRILQPKIGEDAADFPINSIDVNANKTNVVDPPLMNISMHCSVHQNQAAITKSDSTENITNLANNEVPISAGAARQIDEDPITEKNHVEGDPLPLPLKAVEQKQPETLLYAPKSANHPLPLSGLCAATTKCEERIPATQIVEDSSDYWRKIMQQEKPAKNSDAHMSKMIQNSESLHGLAEVGVASNKMDRVNVEGVKHDSDVEVGMGTRESVAKELHVSSILVLEKDNMMEMDGKKLEMDLACGVLDALEVARQVAREVEEEVGIYRDASCSSSSKADVGGEATNLSTADSGDVHNLSEAEKNDSCHGQNTLDTSHSSKVDQDMSFDNEQSFSEDTQDMDLSVPENKDVVHDQESSQLTNLAQVDFDLNENIQIEDTDCPQVSSGAIGSFTQGKTLLSPIPPVSASEESGDPNTKPLLFGVDLRGGGTATASSLRPTLYRGDPKKENGHSNVENCFDLNVADGGVEEIGACAEKHTKKEDLLLSANLPWDESSVEMSTDRINLDLNRFDENFKELSPDRPADYGLRKRASSSIPAGVLDLNGSPYFSEACNSGGPCLDRPSKLARLDAAFLWTGRAKTQQDPDCAFTPPKGFYPSSVYEECSTRQQKELSVLTHPYIGAGSNIPFFGQIEMKGPVPQLSLAHATQPAFARDGPCLGLTLQASSSNQQSSEGLFMTDLCGTVTLSQTRGLHAPQFASFLVGANSQRMNDRDISRPGINLNAVVPPMLGLAPREAGVRNMFFPGSDSQQRNASNPPNKFLDLP